MEEFPKEELKSVTEGEEKHARVRGTRKNSPDHQEKDKRDGEDSRKHHREHRKHDVESQIDKGKEEQQEKRKRRRSRAHGHVDHDGRTGQETKDEKSPSHRNRGRRSRRDEYDDDLKSQSEKISKKPFQDHPMTLGSPKPHSDHHPEVKKDEKPQTHPQKNEKQIKPHDTIVKFADDKDKHNFKDKPLKRLDDHIKPKILKKPKTDGEPVDKEDTVEPSAGRKVRLNSLVPGGDDENEFSNSEDWTDVEFYEGERDDEWLGTEKEKVLKHPEVRRRTYFLDVRRRTYFLKKTSTLDIGCAEFMEAMKYFWWWLKLGGRMPFQTYTEDRIVKFKLNRYSIAFLYFALTSAFLTICTTTMAFSLTRIFFIRTDRVVNLYQRVERLEVDKYWVYALVTLITCTISSSVSLATIFDDGYILADFLTRWNLAISTIKYRPVRGLRRHFWINSLAFVIYAGVLIFLFLTDPSSRYHVPTVRGAAGLIGTVIFLPFNPEARFSPIFPRLEILGLFVHIYSAYSSKAILLMVTIYCKSLVNMSRRWNLRLSYVLGTLGKRMKSENIVAVISFQKLFLEHTVIVGFLRHTGRVFAVGLGIFYTLKMAEMVVLSYRAMSYLIFPQPTFNGTVIPGTPGFLPPVRYTDPPAFRIGTTMVVLLLSLAEWFFTSQLIAKCGDTILECFSFVRRFGLILSKTSQRRRFVQSLNHAFSHATDYHIKSTFTINRPFIFDTFFWLMTICALLTAFSPFQLQRDVVSVCSESGNCVMVQRTRIAWRSGGGASSKEVIAVDAEVGIKMIEEALTTEFPITTTATTTPTTTTTTPTTTTTTPTITTTTPTKTTTTPTITTTTPTATTTTPTTATTALMKTTTTATTTTRPETHACTGVWIAGDPNIVIFPNICYPNGTIYPPYEDDNDDRLDCPPKSKPFREPWMATFNGMDCKTHALLSKFDKDSCKNIQLPITPSGKAMLVPVRFTYTVPAPRSGPGVARDIDYVLCCYDYRTGSGPARQRQLERCNMINYPTNRGDGDLCGLPSDTSVADEETRRFDIPYRFEDLDLVTQNCFRKKKFQIPTTRNCDQRVIDCLCQGSGSTIISPPGPGTAMTGSAKGGILNPIKKPLTSILSGGGAPPPPTPPRRQVFCRKP